jgi:hypothetical protein
MAGLRPLLIASRMDEPVQKIMWADRHWAKVPGGCASVEIVDDNIYLAMSLRNVGTGMAVLHGWDPHEDWPIGSTPHSEPDQFRRQTRDMYIPSGDTSFWQAAIRVDDADDPHYRPLMKAIQNREPFTIDLLYGDHEGGQRVVSRIGIIPRESPENETAWLLTVGRHWNIDRDDPR